MTRETEGAEGTENAMPAEGTQATTAATPETSETPTTSEKTMTPEKTTLRAQLQAPRVRIATWAAVRPAFVTRRAPSLNWATRGVLSGIGAGLLCLVLVGTIALASVGGAGKPGATNAIAAGSPTGAIANDNGGATPASQRPYYPPGGGGTIERYDVPCYGPRDGGIAYDTTFDPRLGAETHFEVNLCDSQEATYVATVPCDPLSAPKEAWGRIFFMCTDRVYSVTATDLKQDSMTYAPGWSAHPPCQESYCNAANGYFGALVLDNRGGLWSSSDKLALRWDVTTGAQTFEAYGTVVGGDGSKVYIENVAVYKSDLATGASVGVGLMNTHPRAACDSVIGVTGDTSSGYVTYPDDQTFITFANGKSVTEPGAFAGALSFGTGCWGIFRDRAASYSGSHLALLQPGTAKRSPLYDNDLVGIDGTLWVVVSQNFGEDLYIQQLNSKWKLTGTMWHLPKGCRHVYGAGKRVFCDNHALSFNLGTVPGVSPVPTMSPAASATSTATSEATPTPAATPTATPEATPTATPAATPTATPEATP